MRQHLLKIFKVTDNRNTEFAEPVYVMQDGKFFRTAFHPEGWSQHPDYDLGNDGKIYRTEYHHNGFGELPDYEFGKDMKLYRTENHPEGRQDFPDYQIRD